MDFEDSFWLSVWWIIIGNHDVPDIEMMIFIDGVINRVSHFHLHPILLPMIVEVTWIMIICLMWWVIIPLEHLVILFDKYHWCIGDVEDDVEGAIESDQDSDAVSDTPSNSSSSPSAESQDDEEYRYENCEGVYFRDEKLILENELSTPLINSLKYFSIMTRKNVSETAHDEYIQHSNDLLRKNNPLAQDDGIRRGEDLEFFGKCWFESSANRRWRWGFVLERQGVCCATPKINGN